MDNIENIDGFKVSGKHKKKQQIILCHTSRNLSDYMLAIKNRHNGKYDKVPNYVIDRNGKIFQLLPDTGYTKIMSNDEVNKNSIFVSLENLGWLERIPLSDNYVNWIGDIYKEEVYTKKWRDYFLWQPYTESQFNSCVSLCHKLLNDFKIDKKFIGHNTKLDGIQRFNGITSKSNYNSDFTDLSPAFNYELFTKKIENE